MSRILLTGGAGFIGSHVLDALVERGAQVTVVDDFNDYYSPAIKRENITAACASGRVTVVEGDIRDPDLWSDLDGSWSAAIHLAARAGVRPSIANPALYLSANVAGTGNVFDWAARGNIPVVYASSSSVYGDGYPVPFAEDADTLRPVSPYGASKVASETLAQTWTRMAGLRAVGLRFFTVYGPRQRPDLAIHKFAVRIAKGEVIPVFGDGSSARDYTHVTDIVAGVLATLDGMLAGTLNHTVYNLGSDRAVRLDAMIASIERAVGRSAVIDRLPDQVGDVKQTWADLSRSAKDLGYAPQISFDEGIDDFVSWLTRA
ncbi:MAG: GDP-mannose 4,6-dehydratase [Deltaproteobacteria bacterium]|nr:GDP-mannose 4,6-dehydratase [Deltaproteobacteria bacterium]